MVSRETFLNMHPNNKKSLDALTEELNLSQKQLSQFRAYVLLLEEWNKRTNLVSRGDVSKIVSRDVRESIAFSMAGIVFERGRALDLGSGAGFPGLPLKIIYPDLRLTLLDSRKMKTLFLRQAVERLALSGVEVVCSRVEQYSTLINNLEYDVVLSRAVAEMEKLWRWSRVLLQKEGVLIAQKGGDISKELGQLKKKFPDISVRLQRCSLLGDDKMFVIVGKNQSK